MVSSKLLKDGLRKTHRNLNKCVNSYYKYYGALPPFTTVDTMWVSAADKISNPQIRGRLRGVMCSGYLRTTDNKVGVILGLPDSLSKLVGESNGPG